MYHAPTGDYDFLFRHVIDGDRVMEVSTAGAVGLDDAGDVLRGAAAFVLETWHPLNAIGDRFGNKFVDGKVTTAAGTVEAYRRFSEAGWVAAAAPKRSGGDGLPWIMSNALIDLWSAADCALSLSVGLSAGAIRVIDACADENIRATYLPALVSGRWTGTMNLTEPQAGTDLAGIRTIARPNDDGTWSLTGQKIFITWGDHDLTENIVHLVLARTPDAPEGLSGLSLFLVPKFLPNGDGAAGRRNAVHTIRLEDKLGIHASPTCQLEYDNATGFLLGGRDAGLSAMFMMMNFGRVATGTQGLGLSDRAYQLARDYASVRVQGRVVDRPAGTPIAEHPDVARLLASMASVVSAMRGLSIQVGEWLDLADEDPQAAKFADFFVPVLKGWLSETSLEVTSDAIQVHGGVGFIEEAGAAQHYRDARILPIYEGTTAVQANDLVGRKVLRDHGSTAHAALRQVAATIDTLRTIEHPVAARTAERLSRAVKTTRRVTQNLLRYAEENRRRDAYAGSVAYLLSWGLLGGGWMQARILVATLANPDKHSARRIKEADFYGAHHLSRISWLAETIEVGENA